MRLTQKADKEHEHLKMCIGWYELPTKDYHVRIINETPNQMYQKLGQLEDIEEELDVELIIIWKAITNGFYGTMYGVLKEDANANNWKPVFYELKNIDIKKYDGKLAFIYYLGDLSYSDFLVYKFEDYGKTWALTQEELTKEK